MKVAAGAFAFFLLVAGTPALAQQEADSPPPYPEEAGSEDAAVDEASPYGTESDPTTTPAPEPEPAPAPPPRPSSSTGPAPQPAPAQPTPVIIRHPSSADDDDDEEPEPDGGDPYDIIWIELFGGASYVDLRAIDTRNYLPEFVRLSGWGPSGGAAIGFRYEFFSAGVRAALARYDVSDATTPDAVFDVGTALVEVKLALPIPIVQPFVRVGFGFAWHGDSNVEDAWEMGMAPSNFETTVFGWVFEAAVGLDIYLVHWFSIGAAFSIDLLNMSRQSWDEEPTNPTDVSFRDPGDAVGVQARAHGAATFHF